MAIPFSSVAHICPKFQSVDRYDNGFSFINGKKMPVFWLYIRIITHRRYSLYSHTWYIQLFRERLTQKNVHATIPKGNMGYDHYTVPNDCSCRTYFSCFPLAFANVSPWPLVPFFQISLQKSELKTTHIPFGIVTCTFSDNLSRNSCIYHVWLYKLYRLWVIILI